MKCRTSTRLGFVAAAMIALASTLADASPPTDTTPTLTPADSPVAGINAYANSGGRLTKTAVNFDASTEPASIAYDLGGIAFATVMCGGLIAYAIGARLRPSTRVNLTEFEHGDDANYALPLDDRPSALTA